MPWRPPRHHKDQYHAFLDIPGVRLTCTAAIPVRILNLLSIILLDHTLGNQCHLFQRTMTKQLEQMMIHVTLTLGRPPGRVKCRMNETTIPAVASICVHTSVAHCHSWRQGTINACQLRVGKSCQKSLP